MLNVAGEFVWFSILGLGREVVVILCYNIHFIKFSFRVYFPKQKMEKLHLEPGTVKEKHIPVFSTNTF